MTITVGIGNGGVNATLVLSWAEVQALKALVDLGMTHFKEVTQDQAKTGDQFSRNIAKIKIPGK